METLPPNFKVRQIKNIDIDKSNLTARIMFAEGEILLNVSEGKLNAISRFYTTPKGEFTYSTSKDLLPGLDAYIALCNAGNSIINRIYEINRIVCETNRRNELAIYHGANEYVRRCLGNTNIVKSETKPNEIDLFDERKVAVGS